MFYLRPMRIHAMRSASMMKTALPSVTLTRWSCSSGMSMAFLISRPAAGAGTSAKAMVRSRSPLSSRSAMRSWSWVMSGSIDDGEDVILGHDEEFLVVELDLGAGVAGEDDAVALLDGEGDALAGLGVQGAVADGLDSAGLGLILAGLGQEDAGGGLGFGLVALDEDLVVEGADAGLGALGHEVYS